MPAEKKNELKGHRLMLKVIKDAVSNEEKAVTWLTEVIEKANSEA